MAAHKGVNEVLGPEHASTLVCLSDLAQLLLDQGMLDEAKPLMLEVMEARRATLGPKHPDTLTSMSNLAALLMGQGKLDEAKPLMLQVLALAGRLEG